MKNIEIDGATISNSEYAVNNVIDPFVKSLSIIIGFIISYIVLHLLQKKLLKNKIYFTKVNNCIKFIEIVIIFLAIFIAVYGKINDFDYFKYGYSVETIKELINQESSIAYMPLEEIPSIQSIGIKVNQGKLLYNILLHISQFGYYLSDNLELIVAIAGVIIIPLKKYSNEISKFNNLYCKNKR